MPPSSDPNLGIDSPRAWIAVAGGFLASFVAFGVTYAFGVFLKPIAASFGASHTILPTLFSTVTVLSYFLSPLTGELADRIGPRAVLVMGALLMAAGLLLSARTSSLLVLYVSYGVGVGAAVACVYIPSVATVSEWFQAKREVALGIAISGTGFGTLVGAPAAAHLIDRVGWRGTLEVFGWVSLAALLVCAALLPRPPVPRAKGMADIRTTIRSRNFVLLYLGLAFRGIALYITIVFLPAFADVKGATRVAAAALIGYLGVASIVGRLGLSALAPYLGLMNTYLVSCAIFLAACLVWFGSHSYATLVVFALLMGVGYGANAAMTPAVAASKFGVQGLGSMLGWLYTSFGVGCVVGPPLAGFLVDRTHDYRLPVLVALIGAAASTAVVTPLRTSLPSRTPLARASAAN
jgi:MFS family permease